jgi:hypothetical protein
VQPRPDPKIIPTGASIQLPDYMPLPPLTMPQVDRAVVLTARPVSGRRARSRTAALAVQIEVNYTLLLGSYSSYINNGLTKMYCVNII